jgi:predicted exporter
MNVTYISSGIVGAMLGLLALAWLAFFIRELRRGRRSMRVLLPPAAMVGTTLLGGPIVSAPIGTFMFNETLWPYLVIGEGIIFLPGGIILVYLYTLFGPR